jgi:hypothetical protein
MSNDLFVNNAFGSSEQALPGGEDFSVYSELPLLAMLSSS